MKNKDNKNIRVGYFSTPTRNWGYEVHTQKKGKNLEISAFGQKKAEVNYMPKSFYDCLRAIKENDSIKHKGGGK
jgi:hypothetical protein